MSIKTQKEVAYYSANLQAFSHSMFERNKQLLIISYLTVGLLFVFVRELEEHWHILFWFAVQGVFVLNILVLFWIITLNRKFFGYILEHGKDGEDKSKDIESVDNRIKFGGRVSSILFLFGIVLAFGFTYLHLTDSHLKELFLFLKGLIL